MKNKQVTHSIGMSGSLDYNGINFDLDKSERALTQRLRPVSMHSLDMNKIKDFSTERSWNL
jgi:hypothetical protein